MKDKYGAVLVILVIITFVTVIFQGVLLLDIEKQNQELRQSDWDKMSEIDHMKWSIERMKERLARNKEYMRENPPMHYWDLYQAFHDYDNETIIRMLNEVQIMETPDYIMIFEPPTLPAYYDNYTKGGG